MATGDELLAKAMRKLLLQDGYEAPYLDLVGDSLCIDGWLNGLEPDEVAAIRAVLDERRAREDAEYERLKAQRATAP